MLIGLISFSVSAKTESTVPGTEIVYDYKTGNMIEVIPGKNGITINGKNVKTGKTWLRYNQNDGKVVGYDENSNLFYGDRNKNTLVKFPAFKSESPFN